MRKDRLFLLLSFLVPVIVFTVIFIICELSPFGGRLMLFSDMGEQYYPFLADYLRRIKEGRSLLWSFTQGGGTDYIALFAYYSSNPLHLLLLPVPQDYLHDALVILIIFQIGLSGLFMGVYLSRENTYSGFAITLFATFYALSSFTVIFYWVISWLLGFALLPLVILGEKALIREGKAKLFIITLFLTIISNLYFSFYTCIFVAITFFGECFINKTPLKDVLRRLILVAVCSCFAIAMTAFLSLPTYVYLTSASTAVNSGFSSDISFINPLSDLAGGMLAFTDMSGDVEIPDIYSGMLCVMLIGPYLGARRINIRKKAVFAITACFLLLSFNLNILDYVWNAFRFVNGLSFRYKYIFSFVIITAAYKAFILIIEDAPAAKDLFYMAAVALPLLFMSSLGTEAANILPNAAICTLYLLIFAAYRAYNGVNDKIKITGMAVIILLALTEASLSAHKIIKMNYESKNRSVYFNNYPEIISLLGMREDESDNFYRTELAPRYIRRDGRLFNDSSLFDYNGMSIYSSTCSEAMTRFLQTLGMPVMGSLTYSFTSYGFTPTTHIPAMFLNLRYVVSNNDAFTGGGAFFEPVYEAGEYALFENKRYLPLGFMADSSLKDYAPHWYNPFISQNNLFSAATGLLGDLFTSFDPVNITSANYSVNPAGDGLFDYIITDPDDEDGFVIWDYEMPKDGMLYVYLNGSVDVTAEHKNGVVELKNRSPYIMPVGYYAKGDIIRLNATMTIYDASGKLQPLLIGQIGVFAAVMDEELFDKGFLKLEDEPLRLTEFKDTYIKGEITVLTDGLLYTSIPAFKNNNWTAYVNGEKAEILRVGRVMSALELSAGEKTIEFRYVNKAFIAGIIISLVSAGLTFMFLLPKGVSKDA